MFNAVTNRSRMEELSSPYSEELRIRPYISILSVPIRERVRWLQKYLELQGLRAVGREWSVSVVPTCVSVVPAEAYQQSPPWFWWGL